jgi:hypothetical protein
MFGRATTGCTALGRASVGTVRVVSRPSVGSLADAGDELRLTANIPQTIPAKTNNTPQLLLLITISLYSHLQLNVFKTQLSPLDINNLTTFALNG